MKITKMDIRDSIRSAVSTLLTEKYQVIYLMKVMDKDTKKLMKKEESFLKKDEIRLSNLYWEAFKETISILGILKDTEERQKGFALIRQINNNEAFHYYLTEMSTFVHNNHPSYMRMKHDFEMITSRNHTVI